MKNNKGITFISLILTVIVILIITSALIFNTENQLQMRKIQDLSNDIEVLNTKVDEYYLKYGELPKLCDYTSSDYINFNSKNKFIQSLETIRQEQNVRFNNEINPNDGDEYIVIDLEKLGNLTLTYGYDSEYMYLKNMDVPKVVESDEDKVENEIFVMNTKTHQIYFPHGIIADNIMYYMF